MRFFPLIAIASVILLATAPMLGQELHCKPCWHNFGQVPVGSSANFSVQLSNTGTKTLKITAKSVRGSAFSFGKFTLPVTLQPGAATQLPMIFSPTASGETTGLFTLTSTARNVSLNLKANGYGSHSTTSELSVTPGTLNFGSVNVGSSATLQATLKASNGSVTISSDQSTSSEYVIQGLNLPITLSSGQSVSVTIQFTPNQSGTATAKAGFTSNAGDSPTVEQLTGKGIAQTSHSVYLTWDPGQGTSPVGYNIYRSTVNGGSYQEINTSLDSSTNYTDSTVVSGTTYYYAATEVNSEGQESGYSNIATVTIP